MAEIRGIIVKKQGERAEVKVDKAESELTGLPKYIDCWNPVGAKAGDVVGAEYRDFDQRKAKLVIYGLPVAGILAGVACGHSMATFFHMDELPFIAACIVLWLLVTVNYARILNVMLYAKASRLLFLKSSSRRLLLIWVKRNRLKHEGYFGISLSAQTGAAAANRYYSAGLPRGFCRRQRHCQPGAGGCFV